MKRFQQVQALLDSAVGGATATVGGPHAAFWRTLSRDQFVAFKIIGLPIVALGDGAGSNLVKALEGRAPFGVDTGTPGASLRRMPAGLPAMPADGIAVISRWIDDGCPEEDAPIGALDVQLEGAITETAFLIASEGAARFPSRLTLRTTDGSEGDVAIRVAAGGGATLELVPATAHVSGTPVTVGVVATTASAALNDTTLEVVQGTDVLASLTLTALSRPAVRFRGRFQCRLATDPDAFDDPRGHESSFGVYAVEGPDPANPDEPELDRIVRLHDAVALRPFCAPIGVNVTGVEAPIAGATALFGAGDPLIGAPVRLGPDCKFEGRNEAFAPNGLEPISDFRFELGAAFSGASAPAVERPSPNDPPGSTAPYADGIRRLDVDPAGGSPADYGLSAGSWAENAWTLLAFKLARLVAQQPADDRARRIRDRRLQEHTDVRPGHGLGAIATPLQLMERYIGLIDRELHFEADPRGVLAYLATLPAIRVTIDFLAFDTDCQTGRVTGTLDAPEAPGDGVMADGIRVAEPRAGLLRIPFDEQ